ncbi:MAG TPA: XRE family transcriptional regulator [Candidatus Angelobacter sp.]|nr:XRE family transcriptional regulator [Candidatus Angelobacter sp.]
MHSVNPTTLRRANADVKQFKAILAAEIIKALDREALSVRGAHARTGIAAADFSRIRNADLSRFTVDRLVSIINRRQHGSHIQTYPRGRFQRCPRRWQKSVDYKRYQRG